MVPRLPNAWPPWLSDLKYMDPINPLDQLAETLRKRIAAEGGDKGRRQSKSLATGQASSSGRLSVEALREHIARSIKLIAPDDPMRSSKSMTVFVESVLAWQFGAGALSDPAFHQIVEDIQAAMQKDPSVVESLAAIVDRQ